MQTRIKLFNDKVYKVITPCTVKQSVAVMMINFLLQGVVVLLNASKNFLLPIILWIYTFRQTKMKIVSFLLYVHPYFCVSLCPFSPPF